MTATATREANAESAFELARDCLQRGWQPVPIDRGQKRPRDNAWQSLAITEANVEDYFGNDDNVGVQLGVRSGGLTQIGGEDFKSTPKRIEKARRVEKCWSLMARLSVKFADRYPTNGHEGDMARVAFQKSLKIKKFLAPDPQIRNPMKSMA